MPLKKELCRNFQRGSCRYGDHCKFLHATRQQSHNNVYGFGAQTGQQANMVQQKPNPFGFGLQNTVQPNGSAFNQSNGYKPFGNTWTRSAAATATAGQGASTQRPENQVHKCTNPESCKQLILEDFQNEKPLWTLTCYGHYKHLPCDIAGDVSFEELRALAYEDATQGKPLQLIVERERNLLNSTLIQYENLLRNPCKDAPHSTLESRAGASPVSLSGQNGGPHSVSSFGQLGASLELGHNTRTNAQGHTGFGQHQNSIQTSNQFGHHSMSFGSAFAFGRQTSHGGGGLSGSNELGGLSSDPSSLFNSSLPVSTNAPSIDNVRRERFSGDPTIWLKEHWKIGEIPEVAPPEEFIKD